MQYISVRLEGRGRLLMWLPDHDPVVRVSPPTALARAVIGELRDWSDRPVMPAEGERYLEAAFDRLCLLGLDPEWVDVGRCGLELSDLLEFEL
jgi:hypothetical protein